MSQKGGPPIEGVEGSPLWLGRKEDEPRVAPYVTGCQEKVRHTRVSLKAMLRILNVTLRTMGKNQRV